MAERAIGITVQGSSAAEAVANVVQAEALGIPAAWSTTGGIAADALTMFAAAAARTERIRLGTAVIPTWPRNPVFIAQQVLALESVAPGRFRLGIGPSTEAAMRPFGVRFRRPLKQLEEYLFVLRSLLHDGEVDFQGSLVRARARIARAVGTPVMASALQERSFELCGRLADGAISWVCPPAYIHRYAVPALRAGAAAAGREPPPVILHVPICIEDDGAVVREAAQRQIGAYGRFQFYSEMFRKAGYPDAGHGYSQELVDELVVYGSEDRVAERLAGLLGDGVGEVMAMPLVVGPDRDASQARAYRAVALAAGQA